MYIYKSQKCPLTSRDHCYVTILIGCQKISFDDTTREETKIFQFSYRHCAKQEWVSFIFFILYIPINVYAHIYIYYIYIYTLTYTYIWKRKERKNEMNKTKDEKEEEVEEEIIEIVNEFSVQRLSTEFHHLIEGWKSAPSK